MFTMRTGFQEKLHVVTIEDLVPSDHFLRKVNKAVDFFFVYEETRHWYSKIGRDSAPKTVEKTVSATDPDAGRLNRPGKPEGMHYLDHQSVDAKSGIVVDVHVTAGNVADCVPYPKCIRRIGKTLDVKSVAVDSGYDTSLIHKEMDECGITREYRAAPKDCRECRYREKCLAPSQKSRRIQVNIFEEIVNKHHEKDGSPEYREALKKRQIWSEGTFAAQKARHNLRQIFRRGLDAAQTHCLLSATAINLKRLAKCSMA